MHLRSAGTSYTYVPYYYTVYITSNGNTTSTQYTYHVPGTVVTTTSLPDVGLSTKTETDLFCYGACPTAVKKWDYYSGTAPSSPTTETDYTYYSGLAFPSQVSTKDGAGNLISQTIYSYDQTTPTVTSGLPSHTSVSGTRANLTTTSQWINSSGSTFNTTMTYDDAGTLLSSTDPNGPTTYGHDSTDTFVTSTTPPTPYSGIVLTSTATYDPSTGLQTSTTGPNGSATTINYVSYDVFGRLIEIDDPLVGKTTHFTYTSTQISELDYQNGSPFVDKETLYDSYGRLSRFAIYNGQAANQDWYQVDTCYNSVGQMGFQSYRYQGTGFAQAKVCSVAGDSYLYDALGRTQSITHQDSTASHYTYGGRATKTIDENGVTRISQTNGLGQTTEVCEISSNNSMPNSGSPVSCGTDIAGTGFVTSYAYDLANHKTTTTQGTQARTFQTDFLGRTILTQEPESGTTTYSYAYNGTGLVVTRTRPQANQNSPSVTTTTTTQYGKVGRVLSITYTDGTPTKEFSYDANAGWGTTQANLKGELSVASVFTPSQIAGTAFSYDLMGRVGDMWECLPSGCGNHTLDKHLNYTYYQTGDMQTSTDGAGYMATYTYTPAYEVAKITSTLSDSKHPGTLLSSIQYGPDGPSSWQLGNGLYGVRSYDSLGRINGGWVCSGTTQTFCTGGGQTYGYTVAWSGARATSVCDTVLNRCSSYGYDDFNRLASQTVTSGTADNFMYVYDRWGNRWQQNVTAGSGPAPQFSFNTSTNQITNSGYTYDAAGNLRSDGAHTYTYDAEGNVINVAQGGVTIATYTYDAFNQRVRIDQTGSDSQEFVFNLNGQRVSIWDPQAGWEDQGQNFWGSVPFEYYQNGYAQFQHQDYLGTERMRTSYSGTQDGEFTSLPFGDAYSFTGNDNDAYHFAMLDHDGSSSTDHAQFRQYANVSGNWMSPDQYLGSYDPANPQSFNRYAYVLNSPLTFADPTGLAPCSEGGNCSNGNNGLFDFLASLAQDIALLFNGPSFHGSLHPRPNTDPWSEHSGITYGPDIAGALGLPDQQCDFGACGAGPSSFQSADDLAWPAANLCIQNLKICTVIGGAALRIGLAPVVATTMLLSMEGDNQPYQRNRTNVADTGITEEAQQLIAKGVANTMCEALSILQSRTRDARRLQRIKATQKAFGCRRSSAQSF